MQQPPPRIRAADFNTAVRRITDVVGRDWVFTTNDDVALYRDAYSPKWGEPDELVASAAVAPISVEEVQAIVRIANEYQLPLYPISTGRNLTYGGSAPSYSESVVVDLKRMNRILEVSERDQTCLVEPGVFNNWCAACHSRDVRNAPGTRSLENKYQSKVPAALEDRTDLTAASVALFVRRGVATMPFYRKTEVSDADLAALAAYLTRKR